MEIRKQDNQYSNRFYNVIMIDVKAKCDDNEYEKYDNLLTDLTTSLDNENLYKYTEILKIIGQESKAFLDLKKWLVEFKKKSEGSKEKKAKLESEIIKLNASDSNMIKVNLFKKVPKAQKLQELGNEVK